MKIAECTNLFWWTNDASAVIAFFTWYGFFTVDVQIAKGNSLNNDSLDVNLLFYFLDSCNTLATFWFVLIFENALNSASENPNY